MDLSDLVSYIFLLVNHTHILLCYTKRKKKLSVYAIVILVEDLKRKIYMMKIDIFFL